MFDCPIVRFTSKDVTIFVTGVSDTQIDLTTPNLPPGEYLVTVVVDGVVSNGMPFTIIKDIDPLSEFTKVTDHIGEAFKRILHQYRRPHLNSEQYKASKQVPKLIQALYSSGVQGLEDASFTTIPKLVVDNNVGKSLDRIGEIVGQPRNGLGDDDYRIHLKGKIFLNSSNGTVDDIYKVWNALSLATVTEVIEVFPAGVQLVSNTSPNPKHVPIIKEYIDQTLGAGIGLVGIVVYDPTDAFQFSNSDTSIIDPIHGFGDVSDPLIGGKLAGLL